MEAERTLQGKRSAKRWQELLFPEFYEEGVHRGTALLADAAVFGLAVLFSRTHFFFGMYPFGLSYLAARKTRVFPTLLGVLCATLPQGGAGTIFGGAAVLLLLLRLLFSLPVEERRLFPRTQALFGEGVSLRVLSAALAGAALAAYELTISRAAGYALYFAAVAILASAVFTFLFSFLYEASPHPLALLFHKEREHAYGGVRPALVELSLLFHLVAIGFATAPLSFFGLSLTSLFTVGATFLCARRFGIARAGVVGLSLGLLGKTVLAPAYAILGMLAGFLFPYGVIYGTLGGLVGAAVFAAYADGISGFLAVAPEGAVGVLFLLPTLSKIEAKEESGGLLSPSVAEAVEGAVTGGEGGRLARLGNALSVLSGVFHRRSAEERRPTTPEYFAECQKVSARYCSSCSNRVSCWEKGDRPAEGAMYALAVRLREQGEVGTKDLPASLLATCPRLEGMLDEIRDECAAMAMRRYRGDRNEFLSLDYAMLAKLLAEAQEAEREDAALDTQTASALSSALAPARAPLTLAVGGGRKKRLAFAGADAERRKEEIVAAAEALLGCALLPPYEAVQNGVTLFRSETVPSYRVSSSSASCPLSGSGDRVRFFESEDGFFYTILSDGMGSGAEAGAAAALSVDFLEALLSAGASRKTALALLNNLVRTRREECSSTVDMLVFDRYYGHATFIKSGAAPSYIVRGGEVLRVRAATLPLGLVGKPDAERLNVEIAPGDTVVMLSDGIVPDGDEPAWLPALLAEEAARGGEELASRLLAEAAARIPEPQDDMTVCVLGILHDTPPSA